MEITQKMNELLDIHPTMSLTDEFVSSKDDVVDFRDVIRPKHPGDDDDFNPKRYYQVYQHKFDFQPNMSILDLLFNEGNEAIFYL